MTIDDDTAAAIGVALNEATWLGAEYVDEPNRVALTFSVLTLPDDQSPEPEDTRRQILLTNVGRIVAALRNSRWDDDTADSLPFAVGEVLSVVRSFGGQPVYGWDFINHDDPALARWIDRASLIIEPENGSLDNRISLFQEGAERHLDLWIWFEALVVRDPSGAVIPLADFASGGQRWWDALRTGDDRTRGHGIHSLGRPVDCDALL